MNLELRRVDAGSRTILERLLQFELYEVGMDPEPDGLIDWGESLDMFFTDSSHVALFFMMDGQIAGFALLKLSRNPTGPDGRTPTRSNLVEEFYVMRPHRRKGVGTLSMDLVLKEFPTQWTITTWPDQRRVAFWRHVATRSGTFNAREFGPDEHRGYPGQYVWIMEPNKRAQSTRGARG